MTRLTDAAGADGVRRAMRLLEARFGKMKKNDADQEIDVQLWVSALSRFDLETLRRQAIEACSKFRYWPSLAEFKTLCAEERKHIADSAGARLNPPARFPEPRECQRSIDERRSALRFLGLRDRLMREAGCAPIDWSKNHDAEFKRIEVFTQKARMMTQ